MDSDKISSKTSRAEALRKKREERRKNRRKPEGNFMVKLDEITQPRMGDQSDQTEAKITMKLDTYSLKEYFRHKKMNKVVKKNQSVQTEKFMEADMMKSVNAFKRQGSVSVTDRRANKTLMNVLGNFARQATNTNEQKKPNPMAGLLGGLMNKKAGANKLNPFKMGKVAKEVIKEQSGSEISMYSDDEDNLSVNSDNGGFKKNKPFNEISNQEFKNMAHGLKFKDYFMESSRYVEKVLNVQKGNRFKKLSTAGSSAIDSQMTLHPTEVTKDWFIGDLQWSPYLPSVFLTTYFNKEEEDPCQFKNYKDLLHIWNVNFTERPEKELFSYSKIQTAKFHPLATETIMVGFDSGMIGIFDLRASKEPVAKSKVGVEGHKSTVTVIDMIGNKNSNSLISGSEDGRICQWDLARLDTPVINVDLAKEQTKSKSEETNFHYQIEPMCISHVPGEQDFIYVGDLDASIHQLSTQKLSLNHEKQRCLTNNFEGHMGPVNVITHNKINKNPNFHGLMLTGSFDWTIGLWNPKVDSSCRMKYTYHSDEITDLSFNVINPFMFSSSDSSGLLCVNALYGDADEPMFKHKFNGPIFNAKWDNSGRLLAVSDDTGAIHLQRFKHNFFEYSQEKLKNLERIVKK